MGIKQTQTRWCSAKSSFIYQILTKWASFSPWPTARVRQPQPAPTTRYVHPSRLFTNKGNHQTSRGIDCAPKLFSYNTTGHADWLVTTLIVTQVPHSWQKMLQEHHLTLFSAHSLLQLSNDHNDKSFNICTMNWTNYTYRKCPRKLRFPPDTSQKNAVLYSPPFLGGSSIRSKYRSFSMCSHIFF